MNLDEELLPSYLELHHPDLTPSEIQGKCREFLEERSNGTQSFEDYFVMLDGNRNVAWALKVFPVQTGVYYAIPPRRWAEYLFDPLEFKRIVESVADRCGSLKAHSLQLRLEMGAQSPMMSEILASLGFKKLHERVEFKMPVADLPAEIGTPLKWVAVSASGPMDEESAAALLGQSGQGDPDWSADDDPRQLSKSFLSEKGLYGELDAIQVGFLDGRAAAIVIAQVNQGTGWSRITYMGILPEFRGRGLGKWVHRHGFAMIRTQGGKEYHGGTVSTNAAMIRLFRSHGCHEYRRMGEWLRSFP